MVKIHWPHKKHWRTRKLINENSVLKSSKEKDTINQVGILSCELVYIKCIENAEECKELWPSYKKYKMEVQQAIDQIPLPQIQITPHGRIIILDLRNIKV